MIPSVAFVEILRISKKEKEDPNSSNDSNLVLSGKHRNMLCIDRDWDDQHRWHCWFVLGMFLHAIIVSIHRIISNPNACFMNKNKLMVLVANIFHPSFFIAQVFIMSLGQWVYFFLAFFTFNNQDMSAFLVPRARSLCCWIIGESYYCYNFILQAAFRGFQVRRQYRKIVWSVGVLEKAILRWRWKRKGFRGFHVKERVDWRQDSDTEEDFFRMGRKQAEERLEQSVIKVQAMFRSKKAQEEYRRMKLTHDEAKVFRELLSSILESPFRSNLIYQRCNLWHSCSWSTKRSTISMMGWRYRESRGGSCSLGLGRHYYYRTRESNEVGKKNQSVRFLVCGLYML